MEKARTYLLLRRDNVELTDKGALAFVEVQLPSVADFALFLGVNKDTIYDWVDKDSVRFNVDFSDIVKEILMEQEKRLLNNGLGGLYAPKVVGMLLSKHGYSEKTEHDITTKGESLNSNAVISDLTKQLNALHRGTSEPSDGGTTSTVGGEA